MEFRVLLERDTETGYWVAEAPGIPGAYTQGATRDEALANLREVFELLRTSDGIPPQPPLELVTLDVEA